MFFFWKKSVAPISEQEQRISGLIAEYPLYQPPHWANICALPTEAFHENRAYILSNMDNRIDILRQFLREFGVAVDFSNDAIINISHWLAENILALPAAISMDRDVKNIFYNYRAPWEGEHRVLNFQFDLGLFFGQAIVSRRKKAEWHFFGGHNKPTVNFPSQSIHIYRASSRPFDPFIKVDGITNNIRIRAHEIKMGRCRNPDFVRRHDRSCFANGLRSYADPKYKGAEYT